jgi:hypothetical protein
MKKSRGPRSNRSKSAMMDVDSRMGEVASIDENCNKPVNALKIVENF